MNQFEFVDPADTLRKRMLEAGCDARSSDVPVVRRAVEPHAGSAAASRSAFRRHGDLPGAARQRRAARERQHARPRRAAVGQGRLLRHGPRQSRSARPRHDGGLAGRDYARRWCCRSGAPSARRSGRLQDAAGGRHHRRLPGGIARADGHAAAAAPRAFLRSRRRGGHHPSRPDCRQDGASVFEPARGTRAGRPTRILLSSRFSRARSACRCFRSSCCGWRWSPPASAAGRPKSCGARSASSDPKNA